MSKVLIITNAQDIHTDLVLREIRNRGHKVVRFHPDEYPSRLTCRYEQGAMTIHIDEANLHFSTDEITAVWYRRPHTPVPSTEISDIVHRTFIVEESQHLIENMYMLLEHATWVNPYFANIRARYKLLQAKIARQVGLEMPDIIVTNDPDTARDFIARYNGNVVYKCVRTGVVKKPDGKTDVIFTNKLQTEDVAEIDQVRFAPCVFQEYIEKRLELRVTIVGEKIFACAIYSQEKIETATDWRRGQAKFEPFNLPKEISTKLISFMKVYGLKYGAFDLILTPEGRFVMLELNPNGQWAFVQGFTGLPISEALADLLTKRN